MRRLMNFLLGTARVCFSGPFPERPERGAPSP